MSLTADPLHAYEAALHGGKATAVTDLVADLLSDGADPVWVLTDVVARMQREVGWRWQSGQWTVAQERKATVMAVAATKVVAGYASRLPVTRGTVSIACVEREWHALPAMIIDCALRTDGWDTTTLGASTNLQRFNQHLLDTGPQAVAVSCSILGSLPTARGFIEASTTAGVPILVGGAAFGADDVRARALGATAWARDAQGAIAAMAGLPAVVPPAPPLATEPAAEQAALAEDHRRLIASLRQRWSLVAAVGTTDADALHSVMDVADDALHQVMNAVSAALLTGDPRPLPETAAWVTDVVCARGGDTSMISELREVLAGALRDYPLAAGLLAEHFTVGE